MDSKISFSKIVQKLITVGLILSLCFIVACGNASGTSTENSKKPGAPEQIDTTGKACYVGSACAPLKGIDAVKEGYKNPFTDPTFMKNANKEQYRRPVQAVNLKKVSQNLAISPNFKLSEFMSIQKGDYGIFSTTVLKLIQKLRDKTNAALKINSAYRSPKWNAGIDGSATWSRHQYGDGVDIASTKVSLNTLVKYCKELGATYIDKYVSHVHCDWRNTKLEPQFFGALNDAQLKQTSVEEDQMNIMKDLTDSSQIHIDGTLKAGNIILLTSSVVYKEDVEELYKKWVIFAPNGDQISLEQAEVSLPVQKGTYQVIHYIGENIQLNKSFFVN